MQSWIFGGTETLRLELSERPVLSIIFKIFPPVQTHFHSLFLLHAPLSKDSPPSSHPPTHPRSWGHITFLICISWLVHVLKILYAGSSNGPLSARVLVVIIKKKNHSGLFRYITAIAKMFLCRVCMPGTLVGYLGYRCPTNLALGQKRRCLCVLHHSLVVFLDYINVRRSW